MKYWIYKDSSIHGPFDKEAVSGLPGVDAGTLVCSGDLDGAWVPAGELGLALDAASSKGVNEGFSPMGLFDRLQIDTSGLIGDDEYPGALAENLFQDADLKKSFSDVLSSQSSDAELLRSRSRISELSLQVDNFCRRISELEEGLAKKERELQARPAAPASESRSETAAPTIALMPTPAPTLEPLPRIAPPAEPAKPEPAPAAAAEVARAPEPEPELAAKAPEPAQPPAPKAFSFGKPKSFKVVPTIKAFKIVDETAGMDVVPAVSFASDASAPAEAPAPQPAPIIAPPVPAAPVVAAPPAAAPAMQGFAMLDPLSISAPGAPSIPQFSAAASPSEDLAVPSFEAAFSGESAPPATLAVSAGAPAPSPDPVPVPGPEDVMARFAKPAPAVTDVPRKPARSNKLFLAIGAVVVVLLVGVGVIFIKQPKEDLKHMTALDDGQAPIGAPALDEGGMSAPAMAKPRLNSAAQENPPEPAPPSAAAGAAEHAAAIAMVKDFPLDGGRGTVGRWLQYSYTASPDAGTEEWNASTTADNTVLVEYRLVPGPRGGNAALYLFEADVQRGMVIGKNLDARQMLAGGSPAPEKTKKKKAAAPRRKVRKPAPVEEPKVVPLLPLPDSGELRPPAEDDGTFVPDTVNSGI